MYPENIRDVYEISARKCEINRPDEKLYVNHFD